MRLSGAVNRTAWTEAHGSYAFFNLQPGSDKIHFYSNHKDLVLEIEIEIGRVRSVDFE